MTRIAYIERNFRNSALDTVTTANAIIAEYQAQGFQLTLRQLYYQFVARGLLSNQQREYDRLGEIINKARLAGLVDWEAIEDRTRNLHGLSHWNSPQDVLRAVIAGYRRDKWEGQAHRVEVWIEKDALTGIIEPICNELDIPYFACRGYTSQSEQWRAGQRFSHYARANITTVILHLGDHDPSGIDMTRDNRDRLNLFVNYHAGNDIVLKRLALNRDQVDQYNPPPNPVKLTDSRSGGYQTEHGDESWELDALNPPVIAALIRKAVAAYRDDKIWQQNLVIEEKEKALFQKLHNDWPTVAKSLEQSN